MELTEELDAAGVTHGGDSALSSTGDKQLRFRLKTKSADIAKRTPYVVLCSPLQRALRTALAAYPDGPRIIVARRLREIGTTTGMQAEELRAFVDSLAPQRKAKVDTTKVPDAAWWEEDNERTAHSRLQRVLRDVFKKTTSTGKLVVLVAHGGVFRAMVGKPVPKSFGSARSFPQNFRPYYANITGSTPEYLTVAPAEPEQATLVLLRHAHSRAQAAETLRKKIAKYRSSSNQTAEKARALDRQIKKFKAER